MPPLSSSRQPPEQSRWNQARQLEWAHLTQAPGSLQVEQLRWRTARRPFSSVAACRGGDGGGGGSKQGDGFPSLPVQRCCGPREHRSSPRQQQRPERLSGAGNQAGQCRQAGRAVQAGRGRRASRQAGRCEQCPLPAPCLQGVGGRAPYLHGVGSGAHYLPARDGWSCPRSALPRACPARWTTAGTWAGGWGGGGGGWVSRWVGGREQGVPQCPPRWNKECSWAGVGG